MGKLRFRDWITCPCHTAHGRWHHNPSCAHSTTCNMSANKGKASCSTERSRRRAQRDSRHIWGIWIGSQGKPLNTGDASAGIWKTGRILTPKLWETPQIFLFHLNKMQAWDQWGQSDRFWLFKGVTYSGQSENSRVMPLTHVNCLLQFVQALQLPNEALPRLLFNLIPIKALGGRLGKCHCSHFTEEEIEAPKG